MKKIGCLLVCLLMSVTALVSASRPVEVSFDKKVIYVDSLTLPKSINVGALLRLLPELLQRPDDYTLSNYEVQIDEVPVGEAADAVLSVLQLADIEKLEVKNSPTASDLNEGQSGAINICLRQLSDAEKPLSGKVALGASTDWSAMCDLLVDYHSDKMTVRGMAFGEDSHASAVSTISMPGQLDLDSEDSYWNQMARAMITYRPNTRNSLQLTLTEGTTFDKLTMDAALENDSLGTRKLSVSQCEHKTQMMAHLDYIYRIGAAHLFRVKAQYGHKPRHTWQLLDGVRQDADDKRYHDDAVQGSAELSGNSKLHDGLGTWSYKVGMKGSTSDSYNQLMPFGEVTLLYGPLRLMAAMEYQWNDTERSDWTGRMVLGWQVNEQSRVRLLMNRQLKRPQMISQEMGGDYITNLRWGNHLLTMNAGLNYCKSTNLDDQAHYWNANLMASYQYDIFFVSLTGNHYRREQSIVGPNNDKYCTYYNVSLMPSVNLPNGWRSALNMRYYSSVNKNDQRLGQCLSLQMNLGKSWRNLNVYVYGRLPLTGRTENLDKATGLLTTYELVPTSLGGGLSWKF